MNGSVVLSHPTGNANFRAVLEGFSEAVLLSDFYTTVATFPGNTWSKLARTRLGREFGRRQYSPAVRPLTHQRPWLELGRMVASKANFTQLTRQERGLCSIDAVYRDLDRHVARRVRRRGCRAVYAYEDGALETFRQAKAGGARCLYDLPIGYWRSAQELLANEGERWPEWAATMPGFKDSEAKLARKDEELRLADAIFVASSFTAETLEDYLAPGLAPVHVIPYGFPAVANDRIYDDIGKRKLRLLFVGGLSQRKGIADVFAVADRLRDDVELTVIGRGPVGQCSVLKDALGRHHWIPSLPHSQILEQMREHDVLLFPSLFEGFGLVITEAMSQGTPVITTDRTAGPDLIEHGRNGWLIEAGSTEALLRQLEAILQAPESVADVGEAARQTAMKRPWSVYGSVLAEKVQQLLVASGSEQIAKGVSDASLEPGRFEARV